LLGWVLWKQRRVNTAYLIRRLDRHFPALEDSTGILFTYSDTLLTRLQQERVAARLLEAPITEVLMVPWSARLLLAGGLLLLAFIGWYTPQAGFKARPLALHFPTVTATRGTPASTAPQVLGTSVRVQPPAYTRQAAFAPAQPSFRCPAGSRITWRVRVSAPAAAPELLLAGRPAIRLRPVPGQQATFEASYRVSRSTLYRVRFAGHTSEDYAVDVQPDGSPTLRMLTPAPYTLVEYGRRPEVAVRVRLQDDYGLQRARLVITTALGQGEGVKFSETITDLSTALRGQPRQHTATATLRLPALGLTYGDELYVYAEAWDNAGQRARTDAALVQWEDTASTNGIAGISLGVNKMPAYFRSQRQIIIDTEKLLKQRRQLSAADFQSRANALGEDQKLLRLRYGKFLGEEYEKGDETAPRPPIAEDEPTEHHDDDGHDHGRNHAPVADDGPPPSTEALTQPYQHLHDDEETADFLEPQVKTKLRAVLSQMWDAELRLRLAKPAEALPFEYRALRLLKEVQQQTRVYVRKSGLDLPPLPEAEKRLTGDLTKAAAPRRQQQRTQPPTQVEIRTALALLAAYRAGQPPRSSDVARLQPAGAALAAAALRQPGTSLSTLRAWRQVLGQVRLGQPIPSADLALAERALTRLLPVPAASPAPAPASSWARRYFQELNR
jgi:hypothetical protein